MQPLVSAADLAALPQDVTVSDDAIAAATAAVRDAAGCAISRETVTVRIMGGGGTWLPLPMPASVSSVTIDGEPVTDFVTWPDRLWRATGWGRFPTVVSVSGSFGHDPVPADVVRLVLDLARLMDSAVASDPLVESESVDDYRATYAQPDGVSLAEIPERTRAALRRRFLGDSVIVGDPS